MRFRHPRPRDPMLRPPDAGKPRTRAAGTHRGRQTAGRPAEERARTAHPHAGSGRFAHRTRPSHSHPPRLEVARLKSHDGYTRRIRRKATHISRVRRGNIGCSIFRQSTIASTDMRKRSSPLSERRRNKSSGHACADAAMPPAIKSSGSSR